jgi:hypothetical protein
VPGKVAVTQMTQKDGHTATMRYDLTTKRSADGARMEVRFERFKFVELDGQDARSPEVHASIEEVERMAATIPTLLVSREGEYVGVDGLDEMIDSLLAWERGRKKMDPVKVADLARLMRSPEMKEALSNKCGDYWRVWVGMWKELRLAPNEKKATTFTMGTAGSEFPATFEHHGPVPGEPGLVRLSMESVLEGEQAKAALAGILQQMQQQLHVLQMPRILRMRRETHAGVDIDPLTGKPHRARSDVAWEAEIEREGVLKKHQIDEYELDWSPAVTSAR